MTSRNMRERAMLGALAAVVGGVSSVACGDSDTVVAVMDAGPVATGITSGPATTTTPGPSQPVPPQPTTPPGPDASTPPSLLRESQGRLLVNDANPENPSARVVDLDDGKVIAELPMLGTPALYATEASSGFAYANQRTHNVVEIIASGITVDDATKSLRKGPPSILDERFVGLLPTHWVQHDRYVVSFNDGDGSFDYLLESTLGTGRVLRHRATTGRTHHGVAVIASGNVFATLPEPAGGPGSLPIGVTQRRLATPDVVVRQSAECPLLHGEGSSDNAVAFGCGDGVLLAERIAGDFVFRKLPNPEGTPAGRRVGTVRMAEGLARVIGNWGNGFAVIDPSKSPATWAAVDIGGLNLGFQVDEDTKRIYALSGDGTLRAFNGETGASVGAPLAVIDAWAPPAGTSPPRPSLSLGHGKAYIPDPRKGAVVEVNLATWAKARTIPVGGQPSSAVAFGYTVVRP
jgi:hypothetical protein